MAASSSRMQPNRRIQAEIPWRPKAEPGIIDASSKQDSVSHMICRRLI